ncbi:DUF1178 family protein [Sinirhodobacter populi]|uniref:DUF1178 family protein n=1 Tax=Paenirhodobacter populi TaxID=2306993 RepID=A0A443KBD1_9RHOB|nr:DUF1178 family protein [Sinirhodobacter populi]RWR30127.1 DUF1178 family protein [Sinirhodobacter populi]RWR31645.1 DUF1178 family protein [Sinirhodobacter populi]
MIRYDLRCDKDHRFDGWFASAEAFDTSKAAGMVACTVCGSTHVEKMLMAPALRAERPLAPTAREEALAALRRAVEENSDYVGMNFAAEARAMHDGDAPERAIWGEARPDEARALIEDGIPVAPLPFTGPRKVN